MRERVEDLGRIFVMIDNILESGMFEKWEEMNCRCKDLCDHFDSMTEDQKESFIHSYGYNVEDLRDKLYQIREIAMGEDRLNDPNAL